MEKIYIINSIKLFSYLESKYKGIIFWQKENNIFKIKTSSLFFNEEIRNIEEKENIKIKKIDCA